MTIYAPVLTAETIGDFVLGLTALAFWVFLFHWLYVRFCGDGRAITPTVRGALSRSGWFMFLVLLITGTLLKPAAVQQSLAFADFLPMASYVGLVVILIEGALAYAMTSASRRAAFFGRIKESQRLARLDQLRTLPDVEEPWRAACLKRNWLIALFIAILLTNIVGYYYSAMIENPHFDRLSAWDAFLMALGPGLKLALSLGLMVVGGFALLEISVHNYLKACEMVRWNRERIQRVRSFDKMYLELRPKIDKNPLVNTFPFDLVDPADPNNSWPPLERVSVNRLIEVVLEKCEADFKALEKLGLTPYEADGPMKDYLPSDLELKSRAFPDKRLVRLLGWGHLIRVKGQAQPVESSAASSTKAQAKELQARVIATAAAGE